MQRSFDLPKYDFEWSFCKEHFFNGILGKNPPLWLDRLMKHIHGYLVPRARYLAHRDFHVRNLMVAGERSNDLAGCPPLQTAQRPATIDFQDARLGPFSYDLASILFDAYWDWNTSARQLIVSKVQAGLNIDKADFWRELNATALQRNFKALGTFAFQLLNKNKIRYAPALRQTLRHILGHFERMSHGEGVIQLRHWIKLSTERINTSWPGAL